jgi:hypothetical protein
MKNIIYFLLFSALYVNAQNNSTTNQSNFYNYLDAYKIANGGSIPDKTTQRLAKLWVPRLSPDGDLKRASNAIYNYATNYSTFNSNTYNPNWTNLGPIGGDNSSGIVQNGQIHNFVFDPNYGIANNKTIYACSSFGGLWRSENDGDSWSVVNTDVGIPLSAVADVAINPTNHNILYLASGHADSIIKNFLVTGIGTSNPFFSIGVFRSLDYGVTWQPINLGLETIINNRMNIREIEINPNNPNQIFIATDVGVYRTNNANNTTPNWIEVLTGLNGNIDAEFIGLEFKPDNSNTIYTSGKDIYKSTDGGDNWVSITGINTGLDLTNLPNGFIVSRINITTTPAAPERLYAYIIGEDSSGFRTLIYYYDGSNWTQLLTADYFFGIYPDRIAIAVSPTNPDVVFFGDTSVRSIDLSGNLKDLSGYPHGYVNEGNHADIHSLEFPPNDGNRFFCGNDGGISLRTGPFNGISNWQSRNKDLSVSLIWTFDDSDYNDNYILGAFQDNGTRRHINNNSDWSQIGYCDGYGAQINDTDDSNAFFISCGNLYRYNYISNQVNLEANNATRSVNVQITDRKILYIQIKGYGCQKILRLKQNLNQAINIGHLLKLKKERKKYLIMQTKVIRIICGN